MSPDVSWISKVTGPSRRRLYWLSGTLLLSLTLAWWQLGSGTNSNENHAGPEQQDSNSAADGLPEKIEEPLAAAGETGVPLEPEAGSALDQYKEMTRYPPSTRRLTADSHDLLNPGTRHDKRSRVDGGPEGGDPGWEVLFTADRFFVRGREPVLVSLQLWHLDEAVLPSKVSISAEALNGSPELKPVNLVVQTDGKAKSVVFVPDDYWPDYVGQVRVTSRFSAPDLEARSGTLDFFFTSDKKIPARFTGQISDRPGQGDLLVDIGVKVSREGVFRIEGNLFDAAGQPFGWARYEGHLPTGTGTATLQFYGLLFHDAEASGPYVLGNLRGYRMRPGDVPHREDMPEFAGDYVTTGRYDLSRFRNDINDSPRRQKMIEMYEDAERRGVRLTRPQYSGDG